MSLSEITKAQKELAEHDFAFNLGDVVFLKTDEDHKFPMMIIGFDTEDYNCNDYDLKWINAMGSIETGSFPEECLIIK